MEIDVVCFKIDDKEYIMEQNVVKIDRAVEILKQYFPDVILIYDGSKSSEEDE